MRAVALALLLSTVACSGGTSSTSTAPSPTAPSAGQAGKPSVEITYPAEGGDPLPPGDVLVALTVRSFDIVDAMGAEPKKGEGHLIYYLDVDPIPTGAGASAVRPNGDGRAEASVATSHSWTQVAPGRHVLGVQLVNNDDTPLDPPVTDAADVLVGG